MKYPIIALCCAIALGGGATAAEKTPPPAQDGPGVVHVPGTKDPEMRSYRSVLKGMEAFEEHHKLAPSAALRFRFAYNGAAASAVDALTLRLAGDDLSIPILVGDDGRFTVPRSQAADDADATFILNKKKGLYKYRPDIRTPGLPDNVRRLGDLRLECYVLTAVGKDDLPFWARALVTTVMMTSDWCGKEMSGDQQFIMSFPSYGQLAQVTIRDGDRQQPLKFDTQNYSVPIGRGRYSDDALIELVYVDKDTAAPASAPGTAP